MHARRVRSAEDVETLRRLRNEARHQMTGHTKTISKKQQAAWWAAAPRRAWLFGDVGFAYVKREDGANWVTLGVTKDARGQGYGSVLYALVSPCFARIRKDNLASQRAAEKAGYRIISNDEDTVVMYG